MAKTVGNTTGQPNDLTVATGVGTTDGDVQRVSLATDDLLTATVASTMYAEDAGHTTGAIGQFVLGVRTDTPAARATTDADYIPLQTDALGRLWTRDVIRPRSTWYDLVTQASAVAALDQLCDEVELTSMSLVAGGGGKIHNLILVSNNLTIISAELWLYQVNPTAAGTNAVHSQTDANNETSRPMGVIDFNTWRTTTDNMQSAGTYCGEALTDGLSYQCLDGTNTTSIWGILMTRTAVTPGATTDYNLMVTHTAGV